VTGIGLKRLHGWLTIVWAAAVIPTVLWWRESILWIGLISCYANFVGHWSAWQAARAEGVADFSDG
jgi:hypothetical protein